VAERVFQQAAPAVDAPTPWWVIPLAISVPLVSAVALGLVSGFLTAWSRMPSFIITLAMMYVAQGSARYLTRSETLDVPSVLKTIGNRGIDVTERFNLPYSALLAGAIMLAGHLVLVHTRFGRYVYMVGGNREAARLAGVRTGRIVVACLAVCALTAGIGGLVNAGRLNSVSLDQNADLLLNAVACVVLGGTSLFGGEGSMCKTVIGVLTFTVLNLGLAQIAWIDDLARQLLMGVVLLVALVINGVLAKHE
jgi:ribose transport system permease protein